MDSVIILELHGPVEAYVLATAIQKRLDVLGNGYTRNDVIEFLTLQQIADRMTPQVDALAGQEKERQDV
jgi:hypothetical protein